MSVHMKRSSWSIIGGFAFGTLTLLASVSVNANPIVDFTVDVTGGTAFPTANWSQTGVPQATVGLFSVKHTDPGSPHPTGLNGPLNEWSVLWNITADDTAGGAGMAQGAQITSGFTVTNNLQELPDPGLNHLQFSIFLEMDLIPVVATQFFGGGGFTLSGGAGPLNSITAAPGDLFNYVLNGVDVASLFQSGFNMGNSGSGTASTSANLTPAQVSGLAGTVVTSIGIRLEFDLTPGETLTFNGTWAFIPAPGCLALLAVAGMAGRGRRRRD